MERSPSQLQLRLVAASYTVVLAVSALLIYQRCLLYLRHPADVAASSGMYAGGDLLLEIFIGFLLFVPSLALVFVIRKSESYYTTYARVLLGLSLTAPLSVGFLFIPVLNQWYWGEVCLFRLLTIPLVVLLLTLSWWLTRFAHARRLISYALLIEVLTCVLLIVGAVFLLSKQGQG